MATSDLAGEWTSRYVYHDGTATSEHTVSLEHAGDNLLVGKGTDEAGSQLSLELEHDEHNNVLTGTWQEVTSPTGEYRGEIFHGALQLIVNSSLDNAAGLWVGFNTARKRINVGPWSLTRKID
jgi:hypothetical protein